MATKEKARPAKAKTKGTVEANGSKQAKKVKVAAVSEADKKAALERLDQYVRKPIDGHLALRDRVIQMLRRHQEQSAKDGQEAVNLEDIAKGIKPLPPEMLRDAFLAEGKTPSTGEKALGRGAKKLVERAAISLKDDKLVVENKEGFRLPAVKLPDDLPFKINPELTSWLPPQIEEELSGLERSLLVDGPEDPLHVWKEKNTLIDGHTRVYVLIRHGRLTDLRKLAKGAVEHSFPDLDAVRAWMEERQGARRNQSRMATMYFLGLRYNREKHQGERTDLKTSAENERKSATDARLGKEYGLTASTVRRAGRLATSIAKLAEVADEVEKGSGALLRSVLLRQRSKGSPKVTEGVINAIAEEKNQQKQEKLVGKLLKGESVGKSSSGKGVLMLRLPRNDAEAQSKTLRSANQDDLKKLHDLLHEYFAKLEQKEEQSETGKG